MHSNVYLWGGMESRTNAISQELTNPERDLAARFIEFTDRSLFLTGRAGTGKTTFLRWVVDNVKKRMAVVAPTGVAAINARGMTIHSFFQIPLGAHAPVRYVPSAFYGATAQNEDWRSGLRKERRRLIRSLDLLIIDEISMVRADLLDAIDRVLRECRNGKKPFGGVQLLLIGDLYQLAPVTHPDEWGRVAQYYETPYFFSSYAYRYLQPLTVELQRLYRQRDESFVNILNEVRVGRVSQNTLDTLNRLYSPDGVERLPKGTIVLSSHNSRADEINAGQLKRIVGDSYVYKAIVMGTFPRSMYPVAEEIELKVGAQVMFCRNDTQSSEMHYFNGKIGSVVGLTEDTVTVECEGDGEAIEVERVTWENVETTLNQAGEVEGKVQGQFVQMPFRLAWAITIHKSQGLTFSHAIIDAANAFSSGQVYVALSRCKTLEGIRLSSKLPAHAIKTDERIITAMEAASSCPVNEVTLQRAIREFDRDQLVSLYDFQLELEAVDGLARLAQLRNVDRPLHQQCAAVANKLRALHKVGETFIRQVDRLLQEDPDVEKNGPLQQRIKDAAGYFTKELETDAVKSFLISLPSSEDAGIASRYEERMAELLSNLYVHVNLIKHTREGYDASGFRKVRVSLMMVDVNWEEWRAQRRGGDSEQGKEALDDRKKLEARVEAWRTEQAKKEGVKACRVLTKSNIVDLVAVRPKSLDELSRVKGFGAKRVAAYGKVLLELLRMGGA